MRKIVQRCLAALVLIGSGPVSGQVLISEIMYNPDSYEGDPRDESKPNQTEWIELYNAGEEAVSLAGFYLQDEDGKTEPLPSTATIEPGEAIVLIPGVQSIGDFRAAWGKDFQVFRLDGWARGDDPLSNLANGPSDRNEILTLRNKQDEVVDEVNYDDEDYWPSDSPDGPSITLNPNAMTADKNDDGKNWSRSENSKRGAKNAKETEEYSKEDVGSPGKVVTE